MEQEVVTERGADVQGLSTSQVEAVRGLWWGTGCAVPKNSEVSTGDGGFGNKSKQATCNYS